jgi:short-subunit dehydrogenase
MEQVAKKVHDKEGQLHAVKVDICKEDEIQKGFRWTSDNLGPVHILINCAGISQENDPLEWRHRKMEESLRLQRHGFVHCDQRGGENHESGKNRRPHYPH